MAAGRPMQLRLQLCWTSAIAALCLKRSEATTAAAAEPGPSGLCAARWSQDKAVDERRKHGSTPGRTLAGMLGPAEQAYIFCF